jgi:hypothetical protein
MRIIKMVRSSIRYGQSRDSQSTDLSILSPRLWKVLAVLAVPFIITSSNYFEALERTGMIGAYIADLLLPVTIIGYILLVFMLRRRDI